MTFGYSFSFLLMIMILLSFFLSHSIVISGSSKLEGWREVPNLISWTNLGDDLLIYSSYIECWGDKHLGREFP